MAVIGSESDAPHIGAIDAIRGASGRAGVVAAWFVLVLALAGPALSSFQSAVVAPLGSSISRNFGGGDHGAMIAQLAITLPAVGVMTGGPLTAWLIGLWGYRPVIIASAATLAIAGSAGFWLDSMIPFLATRLLVGLSAVALYSAAVALTGVLFAGVTLSRMISYQNGMGAFMGMILMLISGWVASHFGWRMSFLIYLASSLIGILAMIAWLPRKLPPMKGKPKAGYASLRPLVPIFLITIGTFMIVFMVLIQGSLLMSANGIEDPSVQSVVISASTFSYAIMATATNWVEAHLFRRWTFPVALTSMALGVLSMGAIPEIWGAALGSLLIGAGSGLSASYLVRAVVEGAPPASRELAVGLIAPTHYIGQFANPFVMQSLRVNVGIHMAFIMVSIALFAGAAGAALSRRRASG